LKAERDMNRRRQLCLDSNNDEIECIELGAFVPVLGIEPNGCRNIREVLKRWYQGRRNGLTAKDG
jgi:hypothetical protein